PRGAHRRQAIPALRDGAVVAGVETIPEEDVGRIERVVARLVRAQLGTGRQRRHRAAGKCVLGHDGLVERAPAIPHGQRPAAPAPRAAFAGRIAAGRARLAPARCGRTDTARLACCTPRLDEARAESRGAALTLGTTQLAALRGRACVRPCGEERDDRHGEEPGPAHATVVHDSSRATPALASPQPRWYLRPDPPVPVEITTPAFVLRTRQYGESDLIVTFITEQHGKLTGIGKGAKNSKRRFPGTLQPFLNVRVVFTQRPPSGLAFLLRCELIETLRAITMDVERFAAGSYVLDLTDRMVVGRESGTDIYALVRDALGLLASGAPLDPLLRALEIHLLCASGWAPVFDRCRGCGAPADTALFLSVERGGLLCRGCVPTGQPVRPVGGETGGPRPGLANGPLAEARAGRGLEEAARVTEELLTAVTSGPVRSRGFLARTRPDSPIGWRDPGASRAPGAPQAARPGPCHRLGHGFVDRGTHELHGVPGEWRLFAMESLPA